MGSTTLKEQNIQLLKYWTLFLINPYLRLINQLKVATTERHYSQHSKLAKRKEALFMIHCLLSPWLRSHTWWNWCSNKTIFLTMITANGVKKIFSQNKTIYFVLTINYPFHEFDSKLLQIVCHQSIDGWYRFSLLKNNILCVFWKN